MTDKEKELERKLREARRQAAVDAEHVRAVRAGCQQALDEAAERARVAEQEVVQARWRESQAARRVGETQEYMGRVYRRVKELDALLDLWESKLPREFVVAARAQTRPDFAESLGVAR